MPEQRTESGDITFSYRVECKATPDRWASRYWFGTGGNAMPEKRLRQAGHYIDGHFDAKRCRIEPDRLVLAGRVDVPPARYGERHSRSEVAAMTVLEIVRWTLATLYRSHDLLEPCDPEGLDLRVRRLSTPSGPGVGGSGA